MAQLIENDPFIKKDIIGILEEKSIDVFEDINDETSMVSALPSPRFETCMESILEKITEFINENYIPKP